MLLCRSWCFAGVATHPSVLMASETQQFAWRRADVEPLVAARACCASEPVFCLETALRGLYWSQTVYRETMVRNARQQLLLGAVQMHLAQAVHAGELTFTTANGMDIDGLQEHQVVVDDEHDLAMLCAYGQGRVVMSFRGTASLKKCEWVF